MRAAAYTAAANADEDGDGVADQLQVDAALDSAFVVSRMFDTQEELLLRDLQRAVRADGTMHLSGQVVTRLQRLLDKLTEDP